MADNLPSLTKRSATTKDIKDLLELPRSKSLMAAVLPKHMTPDRMVRMALMATQQVPDLLKCDPMTLLGTFLGCSALGLEPNTPLQHAYLIPREINRKDSGKVMSVTLVIGYRGFLELARRSGLMKGVHADVAFERDEFAVEYGTTATLRHVPIMDGSDRGQPKAAYCHMALADGQAFAAMPWADVLKIRDNSDGYKSALRAKAGGRQWAFDANPWVQHLHPMARKTAIRRVCSGGEVPLSLEMANATLIDDRRVDYAALSHASAEEIKEALPSFVEQEHREGDHDENGVVHENGGGNDHGETVDVAGEQNDERPPAEQPALKSARKQRAEPTATDDDDGMFSAGR